MIETELKRMFPGIQFHRLNPDQRKRSFGGNMHNIEHSAYNIAKIRLPEAKERMWERVLETNRKLPKDLQREHTR